ncbi:MAG: hypothetical protein KIT83_07900 [Bryobacterales bacterium]|nr:hypothetical protein [Bryobacterales bacterium]
MAFGSLMSLSDDNLRQEHRRRTWMGAVGMICALTSAFLTARLVLESAEGPQAFTRLVLLLAAQAALGLVVVFWMTRPLQERDRRKRLIMRQAIGAFPVLDD